MGDIADMMLEGDMCQGCGEILDGEGFPTFCQACQDEMGIDAYGDKRAEKASCPICGKRVKAVGLPDHLRDKHEIAQ